MTRKRQNRGEQQKQRNQPNPNVAEATRIRISNILDEFRASREEVFTFEENLSNHERAVVHEVCRKMGMTSKSAGRGNQRRVSIYKTKKKVETTSRNENHTYLTFSEEGKAVLQELFMHYPPDDGEMEKKMIGNHSEKTEKIRHKRDDIFSKPSMNKTEIAKKLEKLNSKLEQNANLRQITEARSKLPIASFKDVITSTIESHQVVLISGETGCGKTTQVPQFLLDHMWGKGEACKIVCTQPRRISATSVAERISAERGEAIGNDVGYKQQKDKFRVLFSQLPKKKATNYKINEYLKIRLESKGGKHSSIVFCTNGVLLRLLVSKGNGRFKTGASNTAVNDDVSDITYIIVDEIHERDRYSDFMLAILRDMLPSYPHLRLVRSTSYLEEIAAKGNFEKSVHYCVLRMGELGDFLRKGGGLKKDMLMSATLDAERFSEYFGGCPIIRVPGFTYPVKTFYLEDVLSILKSSENNDSAMLTVPMEDPNLTKEDKVALDEAINLAWSNDECDPLLEFVSSEGGTQFFNYQHSSTGLTPLMVFAGKGRVGDICMLLSVGADCKLKAKDGTTALQLAERENQQEAAELIRRHMEGSGSTEERQLLDKYLASVNPELVDVVLIEQLLKKICNASIDGAILVFLPGWDDINRTRERLLSTPFFKDASKFMVISLHSMVPSSEQKKVFKRPPIGCRKIVLSTNMAETAITIDDVVYVIDSGRMKEKSYDPYNNVSTLQSSWVSKASAKQREGRAGRCQAGICYHLYSKLRAVSLPDYQVPEIKRIPIEELCLQVKLLDPNCKIAEFLQKTLDPPVSETIHNAIVVLQDVGALSADEDLTELGEKLGSLPVHPLTSRMLFFAILMNCLDPALTLACASDYRDPFTLPMLPNEKKRASACKSELASLYGGQSDQLAVIAAFDCWKSAKERGQEARFCAQYFISSTTMNMLFGMRKQLQTELIRNGFIPEDVSSCSLNARDPGILHAVLVAGLYPMVGRLRPPHRSGRRFVETANGDRVRLHPHSTNFKLSFQKGNDQPLIIFDEITRGDSGMLIRNCSVVGPLPLLLLATEIAVIPGNDNEESDDDEDSDDDDEDDDMEEDDDEGDDMAMNVKNEEKIMSSPENSVTVLVDRWLPFQSTALDVAQIYCLRERLAAAILFKVTHPRAVLPPELGASIYAIACILSYDGSYGIDSVDALASMVDATEIDRSSSGRRGSGHAPSGFLVSLLRPDRYQNSPHHHKPNQQQRPFKAASVRPDETSSSPIQRPPGKSPNVVAGHGSGRHGQYGARGDSFKRQRGGGV